MPGEHTVAKDEVKHAANLASVNTVSSERFDRHDCLTMYSCIQCWEICAENICCFQFILKILRKYGICGC